MSRSCAVVPLHGWVQREPDRPAVGSSATGQYVAGVDALVEKRVPVVLATLLREQGETGVQTHVAALHHYLQSQGWYTLTVTPFGSRKAVFYPLLVMRRMIEPWSGTLAVAWYRYWHARFLRSGLASVLANGRSCVIYAQCPLAARAALEVRQNRDQRVVLAVHYNRSQAIEWAENGTISRGGRLYQAIRMLEAQVLPLVDGLVFVSANMRKQLMEDIPALSGVRNAVIPNFCTAPVQNSLTRQGDLVTIGTLEPRKNQGFLLQVLAEARKFGHSYTLDIIGDGPDRLRLEATVRSLGIADLVRFLGNRPNAARLLNGYRLYVHGALRENLPLAMIEALASRLPVAAVPVGGVPEIYRDGKEGVYWSADDPVRGARQLINLMEEPGNYERMAQAAYNRYSECFSTERVAARLLHFLVGSESRAAFIGSRDL